MPEIAYGTWYYGKGFRAVFALDPAIAEPSGWESWGLYVVVGKNGETRLITKNFSDLDIDSTANTIGCDFTAADSVTLGVGEWDVQLDATANEGDLLGWIKAVVVDVVR